MYIIYGENVYQVLFINQLYLPWKQDTAIWFDATDT